MRNNFALIVSAFTLATAGCALAPKVIHLEPLRATADSKFEKPTCIQVGEFKDERVKPEILGHTYNLGVKTSDIKTFGDVSQWLRATYINELQMAGATECSSSKAKFVLSGTIKEIKQEESWNINSSIAVDLVLNDGRKISTESLTGQSTQLSHAASEGEFTDSLNKAVQDLMKKSLASIVAKAEDSITQK